MPEPLAESLVFADQLSEAYGDESTLFTVKSGRVWDKICLTDRATGRHRSAHAFVKRDAGTVHKAEGWLKAVPRPRYANVHDALAAALRDGNRFGGYLYVR